MKRAWTLLIWGGLWIIDATVRLILGSIRVAKSMTFWSVLLGASISWIIPFYSSLIDILNKKGALEAMQSWQYPFLLPVAFIFVCLFGLFYTTERKQSEASGKITDDMITRLNKLDGIETAINNNTDEIKKLGQAILSAITINDKSHYSKSDTRTDNQSDKNAK